MYRTQHIARVLAMAVSLVVLTAGSALAVTKTWVGATGGGDGSSWADANNWSPAGAPAATDDAVLDNSSVIGGYTVNLPAGAVITTINRLTIAPAIMTQITLNLPSGNTANPGLLVGDGVAATDDIVLNQGAILRNSSGAGAGSGVAFNTAANGTMRINNGGRYIHNTLRANAAIVSQLSTAAGTETGIFEFDVPGVSAFSPSFSGRTFGSLNLLRSAGAASYTVSGSNPVTVRGNLQLGPGVTLSSTMTGAFNLAGTLSNQGAALTIPATQAVNFNGATLQNVFGTVTIAGASTVAATSTLGINSGGSFNNNGAMAVNGGIQINNGGFPGGSGTYNYGANGTLIFNHLSSSYGVNNDAYWPAANGPFNVTVNPGNMMSGPGGITMNVARTVNGLFQTGAGITNANQLTLNGTAQINSGGFFSGSPTYGPSSTLAYNVTGGYGVSAEWTGGGAPGSGVPNHVTILQSGAPGINLPNSDRTVPGNLTIVSGTLNCNGSSGDLYVGGNWTSSGTFNPANRAVFFVGTGNQTVTRGGGETFDYLLINKPSGDVVLGGNATVNQVLTLLNGKITTGANRLIVGPSGSVAGANASRYVNGNLQKQVTISGGAGSQTFEVGDASVYAPVNYSTMAGGSHLQIVASTTAGDHGQIASSGLDAAKSVNRHWSLALESGFVGNYDATFNFVPGDVDGGATTSSFVVRRYSGGNWFATGAGAANPTSTQATAVNGFGEFQVGETVTPSLSIDDVAQAEGNGGMTFYDFTVTLSPASLSPVTVEYTTADGSATEANNDYKFTSAPITFNPGETTKLVQVTGFGDQTLEGDESFFVNLFNPSGATIADGQGVGTLQNDDTQPVIDIELVQLSLEGAGPQTFQVSLSNPSDQPVTVDYQTVEGSATLANNDFVPASGTLTFPAKSTSSQPITVIVNDDAVNEGDETYTVVLSNPVGGTIGNGTGTGTIQNDDGQPSITITPWTVIAEDNGPAIVQVTLSNPSDQAVTVDYQTEQSAEVYPGATVANNDFVPTSGTLTFPAKSTTPQFVTVTVNADDVLEGTEELTVRFTNPIGATLPIDKGKIQIDNDDPSQVVSIEPSLTVLESAGSAQLQVTLSNPSDVQLSVSYQTVDGSATLANQDYVATSGTLTFPAKSIAPQTITVPVVGDATLEGDEQLTVVLSNPTSGRPATIGNGTATVTIQNDDGLPVIDIELVQLSLEGAGPQTFQVSLSNPSDQPVTVDYQTVEGSATLANNDFVAASGTLTFPAKSTSSQPITVTINDDAVAENDETYSVVLSNPTGATIGNGTGTGTIQNDDGQPTVSIVGPAPALENSGPRTFFVLLSNPSDQPVSVDYQTVDGSATLANDDYEPATGTVTFAPKTSTPQPIVVTVNDDAVAEGDEDFSITLSNPVGATIAGSGSAVTVITNDDAAPTVSVDAAAAGPEDAGTITINVSLSNPTDQLVTVDWNLVDGTATIANDDYVLSYGTVGIPAKTVGPVPIVLDVNQDATFEADETFSIVLSNPTNATIGNGTGTLTLLNDDGAPTVSIDDVSLAEGDAGSTTFTFTVSLSNPTSQPVSVDVETADGSTTSGIDYAPVTTTVTIPAKTLAATVEVYVSGDVTNEPDEAFFVNLSNPVGATIGDGQGQGTILNDDDTVPPSVVVGYPNGGELFDIGATASLMWSASDNVGVTSVDLYLSRSGIGGPYETIALGESNDGQYDWVVTGPVTATASLRVVVRDAAGNTAEDESDDEWAIDKPTATLVARFEAATLDGGVELRWSFGDASLVADRWIERSEAGSAWTRIAVEERTEVGTTIAVDRDVTAGRIYSYRLVATTRTGERVTFGPVSGTGRAAVAELAITAVTPTPTRGPLRVDYALPRDARVRIGLVDVQGREVAVLVDALQPAGRWQATFDGVGAAGRVPAGVYFVRMTASGRTLVKRAIVAP